MQKNSHFIDILQKDPYFAQYKLNDSIWVNTARGYKGLMYFPGRFHSFTVPMRVFINYTWNGEKRWINAVSLNASCTWLAHFCSNPYPHSNMVQYLIWVSKFNVMYIMWATKLQNSPIGLILIYSPGWNSDPTIFLQKEWSTRISSKRNCFGYQPWITGNLNP